jgi:hypothetical protein
MYLSAMVAVGWLVGWLVWRVFFLRFFASTVFVVGVGRRYGLLCRATHQHSHDGWTFGICVILGELPAADMQGLFGIIFTD